MPILIIALISRAVQEPKPGKGGAVDGGGRGENEGGRETHSLILLSVGFGRCYSIITSDK